MSQLLCRKGTHLCLVRIPIPIPVSDQTAHLFKPDAGSFCRFTHSQCEHDIRMCQVKTDAGQTHYKCEHLKIIKPCGLGLSKSQSQAQTQIPVPVPVTASAPAPACESETKQKRPDPASGTGVHCEKANYIKGQRLCCQATVVSMERMTETIRVSCVQYVFICWGRDMVSYHIYTLSFENKLEGVT